MFKYFATSVMFGIVGMVIGTLIVWWAVSTWDSLSTHWLNTAMVMPTLGLVGGLALSDGKIGESRGSLRALLTLVACPICGFSNYLAFIITSRTWFADKIPADHQSFFFQLANPDLMPAFSKSMSSSNYTSSESWLMYLIIGLVVGPLVFLSASRKR